MQTVKAQQTAPFVGPRPFKEEEAEIFFGRKRETSELISLITAHPVMVLYAASGAGKTSLVNAGLIPKLKGQELPEDADNEDETNKSQYQELDEFDVLKPMRVQGEIPAGYTVDSETNIFMLNALLSTADENLDVRTLAGMTLEQFLKRRPKKVNKYGEALQRVVIFDQFEELFTAYPERWEDRREFFEQVTDALVGNRKKKIQGDPLLRVIFSMREDYVAELDPYTTLLPECLRTRFRLEQMKEDSATVAVKEPFEKRDIKFDSDVSQKLVQNLQKLPTRGNGNGSGPRFGQYVEPVQLQIVCQSLWEALEPGESLITQNHLEAHGDLSHVLSDFYEKGIRTVAEQTGEPEANLRIWFENVLIIDGNRAPVMRGNEKTSGLDNQVVELLEKKNLLKKEWRGSGSVLYELAHDHFIEPIRKSNQEWRAKQGIQGETLHHLEAKAAKWQQGSESLLEGEELLAADLLIQGAVKPSKCLEDFVKASHAAAQKKRYMIYKVGAGVLLLGLIIVSGMAFFAYRAKREATSQRDEAQRQNQYAKDALDKERVLKTRLAEEQNKLQDAFISSEKARGLLETAQGQLQKKQEELRVALNKSERDRKDAVEQRALAQEEKNKAEEARKLADDRKRLAQANARQANSSLLAITARSYLDDDPELSVLLAQKASNEFGNTRAAEEVIRTGLAALSSGNQVLRKHTKRINYVEPSPDGSRLVTASDDRARLWKLDTATSIELEHPRPVIRASFSPSGERIVTACLDGIARVFDGSSGVLITEMKGHTEALTRAVWSPNSEYIATASEDKTVKIWNANTGAEVAELRGHTKAVHDLAWSPDGRYIATEGFDATGRIWSLKSDKPSTDKVTSIVLPGLTGTLPAIAFSPDSRMLITETGQGQATVWDVATGKEKFIAGDSSWGTITSVAFSPDSKLFVTTDTDGIGRVWSVDDKARQNVSRQANAANISVLQHASAESTGNTPSATFLSELRGHTRSIYVAQFSPDSRFIVTASADNKAYVWEAATGRTTHELKGHSGGVKSASFNPRNQNMIVTGSDDGTARVWNFTSGQQLLSELPGQRGAVSSAAFSPEFKFDAAIEPNAQTNTYVVTTGYDGSVRIWDARTGVVQSRERHPNLARISYAAFTSDGQYLVTTSFDKTARIWTVKKGQLKEKFELRGHTDRVVKAVFSPDSKYVVTAGLDGTARVWLKETGALVRQLGEPGGAPLYAVDYSPDGRSIVTAGKKVKIWDADTFGLRLQLPTDRDTDFYGVRYSPNGKWIVTANADGTAEVWNAAKLEKVTDLIGHTDEVNSAIFSPNSQFLATSSNDKTTRVWDTTTWKVISVLRGQKGKVFTAAFSPDSNYLITASDDGTAHIYPPEMFAIPVLDLDKLIERRVVQRSLGPEEWLKFKYDTLPAQ